jgi:glycosyltransferase involved in cell wall biosynthesis
LKSSSEHIDISFVIIGRNEEKNIKRCIDSIYKCLHAVAIGRYEIIYVDSMSTDRSIEIASQYPDVQIVQVTGGRNAAVGRNIGARQASGTVIFFVDGDMEIYTDFFVKYWNADTRNIDEPMVYGEWNDVINGVGAKREMNPIFPGGTFMIKREVWESVGGMRSRFTTGEEADLGLRLLGKGHRFRRKNEFIVNHYTVPYLHTSRIFKQLKDKSIFYTRAVTYRHYLFNRWMYPLLLWRNDKTFILMLVAIVTTFFLPYVGLGLFALYLIMVILRVASNKIYIPFLTMTGFYILSDVLNLWNFFTFYPKDIKEEWVEVKAAS